MKISAILSNHSTINCYRAKCSTVAPAFQALPKKSPTRAVFVKTDAPFVWPSKNADLTKVKDGLTSYEVVYTYSNGKVSKVQEYGLNSELGQTIGFTYYSGGYTEARTSGADDIYNNTDDIITRYVFDNQGRTITSYSTDSQRTRLLSRICGR